MIMKEVEDSTIESIIIYTIQNKTCYKLNIIPIKVVMTFFTEINKITLNS